MTTEISQEILTEAAEALTGLSHEADEGLVRVGERLGAAVEVLGGLTRHFETLPRELEDENLNHASRDIAAAAQEIVAMVQALIGEQAALSGLAQHNQRLGKRIEQLRKTVRAIASLAVNAQIEAAHIDTQGQNFSAFAQEIVRLARTATATTEGYAQEHENLSEQLRSACAVQVDFVATHEATLRSVAEQLQASLEAVETRRAQAVSAAAELEQKAKRIANEIGVVVMGLQIGDITRQRLEHVGEALTMAGAGFAPAAATEDAAAWATGLSGPEKGGIVANLCRMLSAQTDHTLGEFQGEIHRVAGSIHRLTEEAAAIVRFGTEIYGGAQSRGGSFLEELQANLRVIGGLVQQCRVARDRVDAIVGDVGASLRELFERLKTLSGIEIDMRLVGLNTALRCGRLGADGRTLSVVAQELRGYANQTVEDAASLTVILEELAASATQFEQGRRQQDWEQIAVLERDMAVMLDPFEACGARLSRALAVLAQEGGRVSTILREADERVAGQDGVVTAMKTLRDRLAGLSEAPAGTVDEATIGERLAFFAKGRYTMASERDIHARFASLADEGPQVDQISASAAKQEVSLEDVLF